MGHTVGETVVAVLVPLLSLIALVVVDWRIAAVAVVPVLVTFALTRRAARRLGLPVEDEIVAVFCGSKKSMASGVPMAKVLFGSHPGLGLIVLPIM